MADLTEGERIYAVGDIHGRRDLLDALIARVLGDLERRPHGRARLVFLGDYVDRGPDSRGVIERLIGVGAAGPVRADFLLGNHDACLLAFLDEPEAVERFHWLHPTMGGAETVASYGVAHPLGAASLRQAHAAFAAALPAAHRAFLEDCALALPVGGYLFVHAGVRPGFPLEGQTREDLLWIREPFLSSRADHGAKVVHGHTIVPAVEHHANRIALDTGAVRTGVLSCVVLEGAEVALLGEAGPAPLAVGAGTGLDRLGRLAAGFWRRRS